MPVPTDPPSRASASVLVWQGWRIEVPHRWNPIKIEGDYDKGYLLLADMHRPRLGIRWNKVGRRKFDADPWARQALLDEVGQLAAAEAKEHAVERFDGSRLYLDPEPPGRDVWVGYSPQSRRGIEMVYRARGREHVLADSIIPTVLDCPPDEPMPWSIFGLSCVVPSKMPLLEHALNAGDLSLSFAGNRHEIVVRQVSLAKTALARMSLEKWINQLQWPKRKHYRRAPGEPQDVRMEVAGRKLQGQMQRMRRRRRFFFAWRIHKGLVTYGLEDQARDRLVFVRATDEELAEAVIKTVGWEWRADAKIP